MMAHLDQPGLRRILGEVPPWVAFRPWESAEWLNSFLRKAWPYYDKAISGAVRRSIEEMLEKHRPGFLRRITFDTFTFGEHPLLLTGVRVHDTEPAEVLLELDVRWGGTARVTLLAELQGLFKSARGSAMKLKLEEVQAYAKVLVRFRPIIGRLGTGCIGAVTVSLATAPRVFFNSALPGGLDAFLHASLVNWLENVVKGKVAQRLVWPQRLVLPLLPADFVLKEADVVPGAGEKRVNGRGWGPRGDGTMTMGEYCERYLSLRPVGLLHVSVIEAEVLKVRGMWLVCLFLPAPVSKLSDTLFSLLSLFSLCLLPTPPFFFVPALPSLAQCREISGRIAPYFVMQVRPDKNVRTTAHKGKGRAVWNESFDLLVEDPESQPLLVDAMCENKLGWGSESKVGSARVHFEDLGVGQRRLIWADLGPDKTWGAVHLELTYLPFVLDVPREPGANVSDWIGVCLVKLVSGIGLAQMDGLFSGLSDPFVVVELGGKKFTSRTIYDSLNPEWNEAFEFVGVHEQDWLKIDVFDRDVFTEEFMGRVVVPLLDLVTEGGRNGTVLDKIYPLLGEGGTTNVGKQNRGSINVQISYQCFKAPSSR